MLARFYRSILALVVFVMTVSGKVAQATPADDDEALFRIWLRAFAEMKRGDLQADEEHWPKAIAKYRSALKGFEELKADFPHYQEEIVAFRMGDLLSRLTEAQQVLRLEFAEAADKYDQAVKKIEKSRQLEEAALLAESYRTASWAAHSLKSLAIENPEFYIDVISEDLSEAEELVGRVRMMILASADGQSVISALDSELSRELPELDQSALPDRPDIRMSAALFPVLRSQI